MSRYHRLTPRPPRLAPWVSWAVIVITALYFAAHLIAWGIR